MSCSCRTVQLIEVNSSLDAAAKQLRDWFGLNCFKIILAAVNRINFGPALAADRNLEIQIFFALTVDLDGAARGVKW